MGCGNKFKVECSDPQDHGRGFICDICAYKTDFLNRNRTNRPPINNMSYMQYSSSPYREPIQPKYYSQQL